MTKDDKELLLQDLCARLPYGVQCEVGGLRYEPYTFVGKDIEDLMEGRMFKPYLRPMSSMTEEEEIEYDATFATIKVDGHYDSTMTYKSFDFLNAHYFDYRGLIQRGLAIEVTKDNNPYK